VVHLTPFPRAADDRPPPGVPAFASRLVPAYAAAGVPHQWVIADRGRAPEPPEHPCAGVEVIRAYRPGPGFGAAARALRRCAAAEIVHAQHEVFLYGGASAAAQFAPVVRIGAHGRPAVVTIHGVVDLDRVDADFVAANGSRLPAPAVRRILRGVIGAAARAGRAVIVHEPVFADRLAGQYGVPRRKVVVIPLPVPAAVKISRHEARREAGFTRPTVVFFGFIGGYKGVPLLLDGWEKYRRGGGRGELVIAGGRHPRLAGDPAYEGQYAALQARAREIGGVRWRGYVADGDVPAVLAGADALVLPYSDGIAASGPMTLALSYGTPVLLSDALGDLAPHPDGVFRRTPGALADRLSAALDGDLAPGLRSAAVALARQRSLPSVGARTVELYRQVAA
jgi:glycosyltransferase involved in cell wall biosynthesis